MFVKQKWKKWSLIIIVLAIIISVSAWFLLPKDKTKNHIDFYGKHQAGITTPAQSSIYFAVLDINTNDKAEVIELFKEWSKYAANLTEGKTVAEEVMNPFVPPKDTGEVLELDAKNLTLTFGISPSFLKKLGLEEKAPKEFKELPHFPRDQIDDLYSGGDICIQASSSDEQVTFHAIRNLVRKGRNIVTLKWSQSGFLPQQKETPRNLFGFRDGTANVTTSDKYKDVIWSDNDDWMKDGTYLVVRKVQMHLETWDRTNLSEQENTFGRYKKSGAPFGAKNEFDPVDLLKKDENGEPVMPIDSHVYLAKKAQAELYRRSYSYADGVNHKTGQFDSGLLFISFQKDPEQFIKVQNSLGAEDKMNEYITHIGSGLFACFGGIKEGEYIGKALLE